MTLNEYQEQAMSILNPDIPEGEVIINAAMGLCGESGEVIDLIKKHKYQGHELSRDQLVKEIGDVLWYVAEAAHGLDLSLEEIAQGNLRKLFARYPGGFTVDRSLHRERE